MQDQYTPEQGLNNINLYLDRKSDNTNKNLLNRISNIVQKIFKRIGYGAVIIKLR